MRAVVQRVAEASVTVGGAIVGQIGAGLLVLLGVAHGDEPADARRLAEKLPGLRIFSDADGKFNLSLQDIAGSVLVVSQFTLYGDARKGRRPSFIQAAQPEVAAPLVDLFAELLRGQGLPVATGVFGAQMEVRLLNDGPVTLVLDTADWGAGRG